MAGHDGNDADRDPIHRKSTLRAQARAARAALGTAERAAAERLVAEHLLALPEITTARTVLAYAAFGDELDVDTVARHLLERSTRVCFPRVRGEALDLVPVEDLGDLAPGWRGVREPPPELPAVDTSELDVVLVPGLAFDRRGHRLGYGGGHFDRLLARLPAHTVTVGCAFAVQLLDALPDEAHDRAVHAVVTESGVERTR